MTGTDEALRPTMREPRGRRANGLATGPTAPKAIARWITSYGGRLAQNSTFNGRPEGGPPLAPQFMAGRIGQVDVQQQQVRRSSEGLLRSFCPDCGNRQLAIGADW